MSNYRSTRPSAHSQVAHIRSALASAAVTARAYASEERLASTRPPLKPRAVAKVGLGLDGDSVDRVTDEDYDDLRSNYEDFPDAADSLTEALLSRPGADVDHRFSDGETLLIAALGRKLEDVAVVLIDAGADVTIVDEDGHSPLAYAALRELPAMIPKLVAKGGDPKARFDEDDTLLTKVVAWNKLEVAEALLVAGADVNALTSNGNTSLTLAATLGLLPMVRVLLRAGASVTIRDNDGDSALSMAIEHGWKEIAALLMPKGPEMAAVKYLDEETLTVQRGQVNHERGLAAYAWTHRFDSLLNAARAGSEATTEAFHKPGSTIGLAHVPIVAFFMPFDTMQDKYLSKAGLDEGASPSAGEERITVRKMRGEPPRQAGDLRCPLELLVDGSVEKGNALAAAIKTHLLDELKKIVVTSAADIDRREQAVGEWFLIMQRLEAALLGACVTLTPRTVYRMINAGDMEPSNVLRRARGAWSATSTSEDVVERFCNERSEDGGCLKMTVDIEAGAVGVYLPAIIPPAWQCFDERELVLAPGLSWTWSEYSQPGDESAIGEMKASVRGPRQAAWRVNSYSPSEGLWA